MKKFQKTLILAFEVIVQPPRHTFEIGFFFRVLSHCEIQIEGIAALATIEFKGSLSLMLRHFLEFFSALM